MKRGIHLGVLVAFVAFLATTELLACGDKFMAGSRGTRYQRPKSARAASILIYADPSSDFAARSARLESALERQGHRTTTVTTLENFAGVLGAGRFDVVLATRGMAATLDKLVGNAAHAAVLVAIDTAENSYSVLSAIDKAVHRHDRQMLKSRTPSHRSQ